MESQVARNKEAFQRFQQDVFNRADWRRETLAKHFTRDFVDHTARPHDPPGLEGVRQRHVDYEAAFSRATEVTRELIGEADLVAVLYEVHARHSGPFMGVDPTHRQVKIPGLRILRFEDGLIAEHWSIYDYLTTAYEIGAQIKFVSRARRRAGPALGLVTGRSVAPVRRQSPVPSDGPDGDAEADEVERNRQVLLGFQRDVFNKSDWSIPTLSRYLKPTIIDHNAFVGDPPGLEGVQSRFSMWKAAFDDATEAYHAMVGEGNKLAVLYDLHARHAGEYLGIPPTNRPVTIPGIELLRFEDGMMAEHWGIYDFMATAREIGAEMTFVSRAAQSVAG